MVARGRQKISGHIQRGFWSAATKGSGVPGNRVGRSKATDFGAGLPDTRDQLSRASAVVVAAVVPQKQRHRFRGWFAQGEWDSAWGTIFGHATLEGGSRPDSWHWQPQECDDECGRTLPFHGPNYNYRCCCACWYIIGHQLWHYLYQSVSEQPANIIWSFLLEPAQH